MSIRIFSSREAAQHYACEVWQEQANELNGDFDEFYLVEPFGGGYSVAIYEPDGYFVGWHP